MGSDAIRNILKERTLERDRLEFFAGDVLDVKAGLVLVVLTFLAGQASDLFKDAHGCVEITLVSVSLGAVTLGALLALWQWFPVKYGVLSRPIEYRPWLETVLKGHSERKVPEADTVSKLENIEISQASERIETNRTLNKNKLRLMKGCFACVFISLLANVAAVAVRHLFP